MEFARKFIYEITWTDHSSPTSFSICSGIECSDDTFEGNPQCSSTHSS